MPRKPREYLLRHADQADNDMDRALGRMQLMLDMYKAQHEQHHKYVEILMQRLLGIQEDLKKFRESFM